MSFIEYYAAQNKQRNVFEEQPSASCSYRISF